MVTHNSKSDLPLVIDLKNNKKKVPEGKLAYNDNDSFHFDAGKHIHMTESEISTDSIVDLDEKLEKRQEIILCHI